MSGQEVVVVGGGAAGFFAAIVCAETDPATQVTVLEAGQQPLSKVRISGGGRCNVTHACFEPSLLVQFYPRGGKALRGAFSRFQPRDTIAWFRQRGVSLKTEADGRMFPTTDRSETVIHCLMQSAERAGVVLKTGVSLATVGQRDGRFILTLKNGGQMSCDRLLLATGSNPQGFALAKSLGHTVQPPVPSLFTLNLADLPLRSLAGVAVDPVRVRLRVGNETVEQTGALLITHWGVSGPAVLKLSAWGARLLHLHRYQAQLEINWLPNQTPEATRETLLAAKAEMPRKTIAAHCPVALPRRLWQELVDRSGLDPEARWADLSKKTLHGLLQLLHSSDYPVQGKGVFKEEFVTCGGISLNEINFKTMESRICPGLFFAGEILDIDGVTGGFNFQSAWTTGWLAGQSMSQSEN